MSKIEIELSTPQPGAGPVERSGAESSSASVREVAFNNGASTDHLTLEREAVSLPPMDGGKDAWLFLAAVFVVEALVWGGFSSFF